MLLALLVALVLLAPLVLLALLAPLVLLVLLAPLVLPAPLVLVTPAYRDCKLTILEKQTELGDAGNVKLLSRPHVIVNF